MLKVIPARSKLLLFPGLSDTKFVLPDCLSQLPREQIGDVVVLVDGLSANIFTFISSVFNRLGNTVKYIGGGAGSLSLEQKLCLVSRNMFLGEAYTKSLDVIYRQINGDSNRVDIEGVLAVGEISTYGKGYLEFLNETIVVGLI